MSDDNKLPLAYKKIDNLYYVTSLLQRKVFVINESAFRILEELYSMDREELNSWLERLREGKCSDLGLEEIDVVTFVEELTVYGLLEGK